MGPLFQYAAPVAWLFLQSIDRNVYASPFNLHIGLLLPGRHTGYGRAGALLHGRVRGHVGLDGRRPVSGLRDGKRKGRPGVLQRCAAYLQDQSASSRFVCRCPVLPRGCWTHCVVSGRTAATIDISPRRKAGLSAWTAGIPPTYLHRGKKFSRLISAGIARCGLSLFNRFFSSINIEL